MRTRRKTKARMILFIVGGLLGLWLIVSGFVTASQPEPTVPRCGGAVMQPGDECEDTTLVSGIPTSSKVISYDQQLAQDRASHEHWWLNVVGGGLILLLSASGWAMSRRRRMTAGSQTPYSRTVDASNR